MHRPDSDPRTAELVAGHMVHVPGGAIFLLDEGSKRSWKVELKPFLLSRYHVTREVYASLGGATATTAGGPRTPVTDVSWNDAIHFCNALSNEAGLTPCYSGGGSVEADEVTCDFEADGYRLPTEAEWEHACRADSSEPRYGELDAIAWHEGNSNGVIHDVGGQQPNAWGLYDTIGNAWEWCWDVYDAAVYGPYRVFRGGGFSDPPRACRASCRRKSHPTYRIDDLGFRLCRSL